MIQSFGRYLSLFRELSLIYYILCLLGSSPVAAQQSHSMCVYMEIDFITYLLKGDTWVASKNTFRSSYRSQFFFCKKLICSNWKRQDSSSIARQHVCSLSCSRDMQWEILFCNVLIDSDNCFYVQSIKFRQTAANGVNKTNGNGFVLLFFDWNSSQIKISRPPFSMQFCQIQYSTLSFFLHLDWF